MEKECSNKQSRTDKTSNQMFKPVLAKSYLKKKKVIKLPVAFSPKSSSSNELSSFKEIDKQNLISQKPQSNENSEEKPARLLNQRYLTPSQYLLSECIDDNDKEPFSVVVNKKLNSSLGFISKFFVKSTSKSLNKIEIRRNQVKKEILSDSRLENRSFNGRKFVKYYKPKSETESYKKGINIVIQNPKNEDKSEIVKRWISPIPSSRNEFEIPKILNKEIASYSSKPIKPHDDILKSPEIIMFTSFNLFQEITLIAKQNLYDENNIITLKFRIKAIEDYLDKEESKIMQMSKLNLKQLLTIYINCIDDFCGVIKVVSKEAVNLLKRLSQGISTVTTKLDSDTTRSIMNSLILGSKISDKEKSINRFDSNTNQIINEADRCITGKLDELDKNFSNNGQWEEDTNILMRSFKDDSTFYLLNEILTSMMMINPKFSSIIKDSFESNPNIAESAKLEADPVSEFWESHIQNIRRISGFYK